MKVLGISGSPRKGGTTEKLVRAVLAGCECDTEFITLAGKTVGPCIACLGCVEDNVCVLDDDMKELREKIVTADGFVLGAANYYSTLNGLAHCFIERFYQFRHREGKMVAGKPAVAVAVGGGDPKPVVEAWKTFLNYNQMEMVAGVAAQGVASCFTCGHGEDCTVGAIHMFFGPGTKITEEITPSLEKQPGSIGAAGAAGKKLSDRLNEFAAAT